MAHELQLTGKAGKLLERYRGLAQRTREKTQEVTGGLVHTAEVGTAAFAAGFSNGKWGRAFDIGGVPIELLLGSAAHLAGYAGLAGRNSTHLHGFGDGFLAAYFAALGNSAGKSSPAGGPKAATKGLDDEELARMAAAGA